MAIQCSTILPKTGLVRKRTILTHYQLSESEWDKGVKDGLYKKPIKIGRKSFWRAEYIHELIEQLSNSAGA